MNALLVIDVTKAYLYGNVYCSVNGQTRNDFVNRITQRASNTNGERVFFFYDEIGSILPVSLELLARKHTKRKKWDMSAFDVWGDNLTQSALHLELEENGIDTIEVCGLFSLYCVYATVSDALWLGYKVLVNPELVLGDNGQIGADIEWLKGLNDRVDNKGSLIVL